MISKFTGIKRLNLLLKLILVYLQYAENLALFKSRGNQNGFLFFFSFFFSPPINFNSCFGNLCDNDSQNDNNNNNNSIMIVIITMLIVIIIQKIKAFTLFAIHSWIWHWLVIEIKKNQKTIRAVSSHMYSN